MDPEEWGEDVLLLFEMHRQLLRAGMEKILHDKLRFICPGEDTCKNCLLSISRYPFEEGSTHFNLFYHEGKVDVTYTNDIHATKGVLPLCASQCIECETNLRVKEHRNTTCGAGPPRTLEKLKEADKVIEQSLLAFLKRKQQEGSYV